MEPHQLQMARVRRWVPHLSRIAFWCAVVIFLSYLLLLALCFGNLTLLAWQVSTRGLCLLGAVASVALLSRGRRKKAIAGAILILIIGLASYRHINALASQIARAGGTDLLFQECSTLIESHQMNDDNIIKASLLPPLIRKLKLQFVYFTTMDDWPRAGIPAVNIQVSGGFFHHGLLVVPSHREDDFLPRQHFSVSRIQGGIYEYSE